MRRALPPCSSFLAFLLVATAATAAPYCSPNGTCNQNGHITFAASDYPYTEDITNGASTPVAGPQTLTGPADIWTEIQGGCVELGGLNLNGTQPFNALLRVNIAIASTTAAVGARYEVQLLVDGQAAGWYNRRLRGVYPQYDLFTATSRGPSGLGLSAGGHGYTVQARLLDSGTMTLAKGTWANAFGSPTSNPSAGEANLSQIAVTSTFYQPLTDVVSFSNTQPVDFVVEGYAQIDSGALGQTINLAPFLDGVRQAPIATLGIPRYGSEGVNFFSVLPNVPAGSHTLGWRVVTNGFTVTFSDRAIDGVAFPASSAEVFPQTTSTLTVTSQTKPPYLGSSPGDGFLGCGYLTQLLTGTIPADGGAYNTIYLGYVELTGAQTGTGTYSDLWFETYFNAPPPPPWTDGGARAFQLSGTHDGVYIVGDAAAFGEGVYTETINLWGRKINAACGGGPGTYDVGKRFFWVSHIPIIPSNTCAYH